MIGPLTMLHRECRRSYWTAWLRLGYRTPELAIGKAKSPRLLLSSSWRTGPRRVDDLWYM